MFKFCVEVGQIKHWPLDDKQPVNGHAQSHVTHFYSAPQCSHCKRCISYSNSIPSVRLSVCRSHAGIVSKRQHVARCSLHSQIAKMCLVFYKPKNIPEAQLLPPEILAQTDPTPPESSDFWHVLPCSASTVRASEKSSIITNRKSYTGFPTSHQPRFYAAPNFLKMGIKDLNMGQFRQ